MHWGSSLSLLLLNALLVPAQETSVFTKSSNDSLLWGPYRPNLYFGLRPRLPKSLTTALLWARVEELNPEKLKLRFTCEQGDDMAGYGWDAYDPRTGGVQTVHDKQNGIDIETSFVKFDEGRGGWGARIKGKVRKDAEPWQGSQGSVKKELKSTVYFAVGLEGLGGLELEGAEAAKALGFEGDVVFRGETADLDAFKLVVTAPASNSNPMTGHPAYALKPLDHTLVHSLQLPDDQLWDAKAHFFASLEMSIQAYAKAYTPERMPPAWQSFTIQNNPGQGNMHLIQKVFEGDWEFDVLYTPSAPEKAYTSSDLTKAIDDTFKNFNTKFEQLLAPKGPFKGKKYLKFSQALFSNLIGGIGYFHGSQVIDRSYSPEYDEENEGFWEAAETARSRAEHKLEGPYELFTSVPSRPFFPRGFLWDEGFQILSIVNWDPEIVMRIVSSWFGTMDEDGWIAREQIIGAEARSKVPKEFEVQYPHYANPPTLFMAVEAVLDRFERWVAGQAGGKQEQQPLGVDPDVLPAWLKQLYPRLQRNFEWYRKTQYGDIKSYDRKAFSTNEAYRWRGRTPGYILTSGLDDYPHAQPPHPGELHVDLISWMGMMSRALHRVASYLGETEDAERYARILEAIRRNTDDLHWSKKEKTYCDATIDDFEESVLVCNKGYVSIFPFLTGLMGPEHAHLGEVLDFIRDENELWSPYGVRSMSKRSEFYGTGENYWRGPVWININYLIIQNLLRIAQQPGPQQSKASKMYTSLRKNIVGTVYESWKETGFAWEQYNPDTGKGQRTQHFTGWTSLVVRIMGMPETPVKGGKGKHDEL